jgi:energy-coupling factor transport system permease protein
MIAGGSANRVPGIAKLHPRARLAAIAILMLAALFLQAGWQFSFLVAILLALILIARVPWSAILRGIGALATLIMLSFFLQLLLAPGEPLVQWGPLAISKAGLRQGAVLAGRLILLAGLSALLAQVTSPLELTEAVEEFLRPLACLGLPARRVALIIGTALRFVPQLQREAEHIARAQAARGAPISGSLRRRGRRLLAILIPLLLDSLRRAERLAEAMEARCYSENRPRSSLNLKRFRASDWLAPGAALTVALLLLLPL